MVQIAKTHPKHHCGDPGCVICSQIDRMFKNVQVLEKDFDGTSPPQVFIGSKLEYPKINVGILSPGDKNEMAWLYNDQKFWHEQGYNIKQIMHLRSSLVNSRFRTKVDEVQEGGRFLDISQEIGMAYKPVEVEIGLKKKPRSRVNYEQVSLPMGPSGSLEKAKITANTKIHTKVDKVVSDTDLKSVDALSYLSQRGFDENVLSQLLSVGVLGVKKNRKLVPTRFSITAVDDTLGKQIINEIKRYPSIDDYRLYMGNYLGNYYFIMLFPDVWGYELFEGYIPGSFWNPDTLIKWSTDCEDYKGRTSYVSETSGGYFAARTGILEELRRIRRQARIVCVRFETPEYYMGLGVFVVRNASRNAMNSKPVIFDNQEEMLQYAKDLILNKFKYDISRVLQRSVLLQEMKQQKKLSQYFS